MEDNKKSQGGLKFSPAWKGGTLIIFFLILYTLYHVFFGLSDSIETTAAGLVRESVSIDLEGIIFRDEKGIEGNIYPYLNDGERITTGGVVGEKCSSFSIDELERITQLKKDLYILEQSNDKALFSVVDIQQTEKQIDELYTAIMKAISSQNLYKAEKLKEQLLIALNKMEIYKGNIKNYDAQISSIKSELDNIYLSVRANKEYVYAENGGYAYYECDGYENELSLEKLSSLSANELRELTEKIKREPIKNTTLAYKLVFNHTWYLSSVCDKNIASKLREGNNYTVTFFDIKDRQIDMTLEKITDNGDKTVLIFSCNVMPQDFEYLRYQEFKIDILGTEGYRVPKDAVQSLKYDNGNQIFGVYILESSVVHFRKIEILSEGDGYYIVSKIDASNEKYKEYLHLNDRIILNTKGMYEGKILKK